MLWEFSKKDYITLPDLKGDESSIADIGTSTSVGLSVMARSFGRRLMLYFEGSTLLFLLPPSSLFFLFAAPVFAHSSDPSVSLFRRSLLLFALSRTEVWHLIATQGVICAIGSGLLYSPTTLYLDEWWGKKEGLTYGSC